MTWSTYIITELLHGKKVKKINFKLSKVCKFVEAIHNKGDIKYFLGFIPYGTYKSDVYNFLDVITFIDAEKIEGPLSKISEITYPYFLLYSKDEYDISSFFGILTIKSRPKVDEETFNSELEAFAHLIDRLKEEKEPCTVVIDKGLGHKTVSLASTEILNILKDKKNSPSSISHSYSDFINLVYKQNGKKKTAKRGNPKKSSKQTKNK